MMLAERELRPGFQKKTKVISVKSKEIFYAPEKGLEISSHELIKMTLKTSAAWTIKREFLEIGEMSKIVIK